MMDDQPRPYLRWVFSGFVVLVVVGLAAVAMVSLLPEESPPAPPPTTLPSAGSTSSGSTSGAATLSIDAKLGPVGVNDFIHDDVTEADPQNPGLYYLAGSPGYCLTDGSCPGGYETTNFNITYDSKKQFFTVALLAEPLGEIRTETEQFMLKTLGITGTELCTLNYYVGTVSALNDYYAGKNLGFSFCPNATVLP